MVQAPTIGLSQAEIPGQLTELLKSMPAMHTISSAVSTLQIIVAAASADLTTIPSEYGKEHPSRFSSIYA